MENSPGTQLHLVIDPALAVTPAAESVVGEPPAQVLQTLRLPAGVSFLRPNAASRELLHETSDPRSLILEPQPDGPQPRLLLLAPRGIPAPTVNGRRAPRVCLLRVGDQLLLDDGRLLHLTAYDEPRVGPLAEQQADLRCARRCAADSSASRRRPFASRAICCARPSIARAGTRPEPRSS